MVFQTKIKELLEAKSGQKIVCPADCDALAKRINVGLGGSTIGRLWGFEKDVTPRVYTLNMIAEYLGYKDWKDLEDQLSGNASSVFEKIRSIAPEFLPSGCKVKYTYDPDRTVILAFKGNCEFEVESAMNTQNLQVGDNLTIYYFIEGENLYVHEVKRKGVSMGSYHTKSPITSLYAE